VLDRYLARTGFDAQQTDQPTPADQPANLWEPADGPNGRVYGAHGEFGKQSRRRSAQVWASQHHGGLAIAGTTALLAGAAALARRAAGR
jgi:hypothetical protein